MENFLTENKQINQEETFLCCASGSDAKTNKQKTKNTELGTKPLTMHNPSLKQL